MTPAKINAPPGTTREAAELRLLGGFELLSRDKTAIELPTRKSRLLLAFLASPPGQSHSREKLAGLFWPDTQEEQARGSLRYALAGLRNALTPLAIDSGRDEITLSPGCLCIDVDQLARAASGSAPPGALDAGLIYRGEFLDGYSLDNQDFIDWLLFERTRCRNLAQAAFEQAIFTLEQAGGAIDAISLAQRLVALDPLREQSHRVLMKVYATAGERSKALEQYQSLKDLLKKELDIAPSPRSIALAREILAESVDGSGELASSEQRPHATPQPSKPIVVPPGPLSVVVLPLASLSESSDDQLVARGFSEDLITQLSRLPELFVIARQSSDQFPSASASASSAAGDLGVRYAVSGTYRRAADQLRVTVQLTEAATNRCVWAERYDGLIGDAFAIQDDIIFRVAGALDANIRLAERQRAARLDGEEFGAWEMAHRGLWHLQRFTASELEAGQMWLERAIVLSPRFSMPHAGLAYIAYVRAAWGLSDDLQASLMAAVEHGKHAIQLDPQSAFAYSVMGRVLMLTGRLQEAFDYQRRALDLNPSFAHAYFGLAQAHMWAGEQEHALPLLELVLRLSPKDPLLSTILNFTAFSHFGRGDFQAAEVTARQSIQADPTDRWSRLALAAALSGSGRHEEARQAIAAARALSPALSIGSIEPFIRHAANDFRKAILAALMAAGLS
jgi:DNA-binding SARP family transcriptional activator/TolB-like protein/cytochrome c-type biogenesis protein CcmH/NrfG